MRVKKSLSYTMMFFCSLWILIQYIGNKEMKVNSLRSISIVEKQMLFFHKITVIDSKNSKFDFIFNEIKEISKNITEVRKSQTNIFFSDYINVNFNSNFDELWVFWGNEKVIIKTIQLTLVYRNKNIPIIVNNELTFFVSYKKYKEFVSIINSIKKEKK